MYKAGSQDRSKNTINFMDKDSVNTTIIPEDVIHGYYRDEKGYKQSASILVYNVQFHVQVPGDEGWRIQIHCIYDVNNLIGNIELVEALPPSNCKFEENETSSPIATGSHLSAKIAV